MGYKEFDVDTKGHNGEIVPFTFNLANISYYRPFVESSEKVGEKPQLTTMVYLVGSVKAIKVNCSRDEFKAKIAECMASE
jgi:hypothetical protein